MENKLDEKLNSMKSMADNANHKIDRKSFFCELQDIPKIWKRFLILPAKPSTINLMMDTLGKNNATDEFYKMVNVNHDKVTYCNTKENITDKKYSTLADQQGIDFFMHNTNKPDLLLYITAIVAPYKLNYLGLSRTAGAHTLTSYVQAVKRGVKIVDTINVHMAQSVEQNKLSNYFIFSRDILDAYQNWYANYGWLFGAEEDTTHYEKNFDKWIEDYQKIDHTKPDVQASDKIDTKWPITNEFVFRNPISLKFCHKIIISEDDLRQNKLLQLMKKLCPNTFTDPITFENERASYNFTGVNEELVNLNYDLIYLLLEEYNNINVTSLDKFRIKNGIDNIYYFTPPKTCVFLVSMKWNPSVVESQLLVKMKELISSKVAIPVYKYTISSGGTRDIYMNNYRNMKSLVEKYGYTGNLTSFFMAILVNDKITVYDLPLSLEGINIEELVGKINLLMQGGQAYYYHKYVKYKTKYLKRKNGMI